jgi:two-component system sensor histidine kinase PilS (NtrC family)
LFYYNIYRFVLVIVLVFLALPNFNLFTIGYSSWVPQFAILGFILVSVVALITIKKQSPAIHIQAHCLFLADILFISALAISHELHDSNIVIFFITTVGATAVIFRTKTALAYSIIAIFVIYIRDSLDIFSGISSVEDLYLSALTSIGLLTIVVIVSRIAQRTRVVQSVLEKQELDLADLDDVNQIIIDQLEIGVLFLEDDMTVKLINSSARDLITEFIVDARATGKLAELLKLHISSPSRKLISFRHKDKVLNLSTTTMRSGFLVHIEDRTQLSRQITQTKLSTVGRFASAISHEIRNPLNAINHAAQLLNPHEKSDQNVELVDIIRKHVKRIDGIIESVLDRSQPGRAQQKQLVLNVWLETFIDTFKQTLGTKKVSILISGNPITIYFDPVQLDQVLTNLCQNSIQHAPDLTDPIRIKLVTGFDHNQIPYLDIIDNGRTIPDSLIDQLFEPFYTTDSKSTGLGLYLSRAFCNLNGADLDYFTNVGHHGFRLSFKLQDTV